MILNNCKSAFSQILCAILLCALAFAVALPAKAQDHVINLKDADIRAFIEDTSVLTGKTFIIDPRVTGTVSVSSQAKLTEREVFQVFLDVLKVRGFTAIPSSNGSYMITLIQGAAQDAPFTSGSGQSGTLSTAVLKLNQGDAAEAAKLIKPILHSQGRLTANAGGRVMVITDYPENLRKAREILAALNVEQSQTVTVPLVYITANDAKEAIDALTGTTSGRQTAAGAGNVRVVAMEASNSLILRGDGAEISSLARVVRDMDTTGSRPRGKVSVMSLKFADGAEILPVIEKILPAFMGTSAGAPEPSIAHEPSSNSLIINADAATQAALESVIRQLDVRRAQVLVEALIVEVSDTVAKDLGVQFALSGTNGSTIPFVSTNYSRSAPNLLAITGALAGDSLGTTGSADFQDAAVTSLLGLNGGTIGVGGTWDNGVFGAVLNAVQNDTDSNVLSTPFVTTMDNVPATFLVGQEVPFTSGEALGSDNTNPFRTITREEVGIKLEVLPQINEGDAVRLEIKQEISSISAEASIIATDLVTNKREIATTVLAEDGEVIVLGGLIQDDEQLSRSQVPILGDIPLIGNAFRSKNNSTKRTNLMVFIRPTIIRDSSDARPLTQDMLDVMRSFGEQSQLNPSQLDDALARMGIYDNGQGR